MSSKQLQSSVNIKNMALRQMEAQTEMVVREYHNLPMYLASCGVTNNLDSRVPSNPDTLIDLFALPTSDYRETFFGISSNSSFHLWMQTSIPHLDLLYQHCFHGN